jgi:hypothetical protein
MKNAPQFATRLVLAGLAAGALSLSSCATHMEVPLQWKPTTEIAELQAKQNTVDLGGAKVQFVNLEDTRKNPARIGEQPDAKEPRTVSTKDNVGAFVAKYLADSIAKLTPGSGLQISNTDATAIVSGQVLDFFVTEQANLKYEAVVRLRLLVKKPDGTALYEGTTVGKSTRPGFPFKADNYMEGLSNCILSISNSLVEDAGFRKALKGG